MAIKIALAGNPNCGKTTLFNALTGSNQYVGNWPGVTVEKKEGRLRGHRDVTIQDLPGIYSLSPYTSEEVVSRNYLVNDKPDAILNIIDGTNIERNLYLTTQLMEIGLPMVIAINMMDLVRKNGDKIDIKKLSQELGCRVIEISALRGEAIDEAAELCIEAANENKKVVLPQVYNGSVETTLKDIESSISSKVDPVNLRWYAVKIFERDSKALEQLNLDKPLMDQLEVKIKACEKEEDDDSESIITNQRYNYIQKVVAKAVKKGHSGIKMSVSDRIDKVVTNRWLAIPIFVLIMGLTYYLSLTLLGTPATDWVNDTLFGEWIEPGVRHLLENAGVSAWLVSLIDDGIIHGLGTPIGFVPQMAFVFLFMSILEDCGYMARVAFIMDRIFRRFGLSGKSFIPFMISSGCGVPGIMATRTIESEKDRRMTMMTTTMIPCGAKLPVIALIAGYLMGGAWWMAPTFYFVGIGMVIIYCIILKKTKAFAGDPVPFVMELPAYHIPSVKGVLLHVWERVWAFIKKAGTILFLCVTVMWFLSSFGFHKGTFGLVDPKYSMLAAIGTFLAPIFMPLGFGTWQAVASTLSGFVAKEGIVSTMGQLSALNEAVEDYTPSMHQAFSAFFPTSITAISFLLFNLFDSPCLAAISTLAKEMNNRRYFWYTILFQNVMAWIDTLIFYQIVGLFAGEVSFNFWTIAAFAALAWMLYMLFRPDPNARAEKLERMDAKAQA